MGCKNKKLTKYLHAIPVVNRPDLLEKSLDTIKALWPYTVIIDNSKDQTIGSLWTWPVKVVVPSVPLTIPQTLNFIHKLAKQKKCDFYGWNHNDVFVFNGEDERYVHYLKELDKSRNWGAIFTESNMPHAHKDQMAAFNPKAVDFIGGWDNTFPDPNAHYDDEFYYKMKVAGFELIQSGVLVNHDEPRTTNRSDQYLQKVHNLKLCWNDELYITKWGGRQQNETYSTPFNL